MLTDGMIFEEGWLHNIILVAYAGLVIFCAQTLDAISSFSWTVMRSIVVLQVLNIDQTRRNWAKLFIKAIEK